MMMLLMCKQQSGRLSDVSGDRFRHGQVGVATVPHSTTQQALHCLFQAFQPKTSMSMFSTEIPLPYPFFSPLFFPYIATSANIVHESHSPKRSTPYLIKNILGLDEQMDEFGRVGG